MMMMKMEEYLPLELIYNIFARLPVESLFRFRCVCRKWRALIDDPLLRELHTQIMLDSDDYLDKQSDSDYSVSFLLLARFGNQRFYEFQFGDYFDESSTSSSSRCYKVTKPIKDIHFDNPNPYYADGNIIVSSGYRIHDFKKKKYSTTVRGTIVGSCNGLVCFAIFFSDAYYYPDLLYVFNPVTKEQLRIPNLEKECRVCLCVNGFGYLSSTKEYKVVRIFYYVHSPGQVEVYNTPGGGQVEVYTLGSGKWRGIGQVPSIFVPLVRLPGVLVNEALHWIDDDGKIALFDLATERFRMVSSPSPPPLTLVPNNARYYELGVMRGRRRRRRSLCVIEHNIHKSVDVWVMDEEDLGEGSWTMEFKIPIRGDHLSYDDFDHDWEEFDDYNFVTITKSGKVLLWYNGTGLVSYDPKTEEFILHGDYKADASWFDAVIHRKSFVSIKALGEDSVMFSELEVIHRKSFVSIKGLGEDGRNQRRRKKQ